MVQMMDSHEQLRDLVMRRTAAPPAEVSHASSSGTNYNTSATAQHNSDDTRAQLSDDEDADGASFQSAVSRLSIRSLIYYDWRTELITSRAYKRLRYKSKVQGLDALASSSGFSLDTNATKGDTWTRLSAMSLGDLSITISEISVFELPIFSSDSYDPAS